MSGTKDGVRANDVHQFRKQLLLQLYIFGRCLDDQVRAAHAFERTVARYPHQTFNRLSPT